MNGKDYFLGVDRVNEDMAKKKKRLIIIGIILLISCFTLLPLISRNQPSMSVRWVCFAIFWIVMIAGIMLVILGIALSSKERVFLTDAKYDELVNNLINQRASDPKEYLGLDETEIMEIEPIVFDGYKFDDFKYFKKGNDSVYRTHMFERATIFFTHNEVHMYKAIANSITGQINEITEVLFYDDIVSVATQNKSTHYGKYSIDFLSFILTSKGGSTFEVALRGNDSRQRSINAMRALIKEKKTKS